MDSRRMLPFFMSVTILVIIAFQVYWVRDNYEREKRTMQIKAGVAFTETIRQLQSYNLKLPDSLSHNEKYRTPKRIIINKDIRNRNSTGQARSEMVTMVDAIRNNFRDSSKKFRIRRTDTTQRFQIDQLVVMGQPGDSVSAFKYLYGLDALQDTLKISDINNALDTRFKKEKIKIDFTVKKLRQNDVRQKDSENEKIVEVGFVNPIAYQLTLGDSFKYLIQRISFPLLFSIFLIAVTIFSFVLLYKNVLRQQKLAEIKNDFISNITHELKTPIATVGVAIEAMKNFNAIDDPEKTREYLNISSNELQRLGLLVDNVLKISLFEKKKIQLVNESIDLSQLTSEVLDTMKIQFKKYNAIVEYKAPEESMIIKGDRLHIMSVLFNLLDNALKYKREQPHIIVNILRSETNITLQVKDNGIGIDSMYKSKIFEKFFRVPMGNTHAVKGYGLGLSYVSHIMAQHKGSISVDSEIGKGSTFIINFPA